VHERRKNLEDIYLHYAKTVACPCITLNQGYSNGGPQSQSGPLDGDGRTSSASQSVFFTQKFLSQNFALLAVLPKHLFLANCAIVDQAVVQLNCSAHLSWAS